MKVKVLWGKVVEAVWVNKTFDEVPTSDVKNVNRFGLQPSNIRIDTNEPSTWM